MDKTVYFSLYSEVYFINLYLFYYINTVWA